MDCAAKIQIFVPKLLTTNLRFYLHSMYTFYNSILNHSCFNAFSAVILSFTDTQSKLFSKALHSSETSFHACPDREYDPCLICFGKLGCLLSASKGGVPLILQNISAFKSVNLSYNIYKITPQAHKSQASVYPSV